MTTQDRQPSRDSGPDDRDAVAVSPAIGPLPAIHSPRLPRDTGADGAPEWDTVRAARLACEWVTRHMCPLRHHLGGKMPGTPDDLRYSRDHLWVRRDAGASLVRVGITDFAQESLGDVVDVSPPRPGDTITVGQPCGDIESVKSVNDLIAPLTGTVRTRNEDLAGAPELVNTDPYGQGWLFEAEIEPSTLDRQLAGLMDADAYRDLAGA